MELRIDFAAMVWENPKTGVYQKVITDGQKRIRLLRFEEGFTEDGWCERGHIGYVLNGKMDIDFNGALRTFTQGDGLWIEEGEASKHKVIMGKGDFVELVLFEEEG